MIIVLLIGNPNPTDSSRPPADDAYRPIEPARNQANLSTISTLARARNHSLSWTITISGVLRAELVRKKLFLALTQSGTGERPDMFTDAMAFFALPTSCQSVGAYQIR
jgi:hypothetical protein